MRTYHVAIVGAGPSGFFAAASLTSVPPAVDLTQDRVSVAEIVERNQPVWLLRRGQTGWLIPQLAPGKTG